ncbi:MAG: NAD(P)H-hydrate dehydratase [Thermoplasmata archaeon]|nr:NAD(P)H-hydrate dehydratase [Thermoplasmata archaeon]
MNASPLSALEMAVAEHNAVGLGISIDALMENAGRAVAEEAIRHLPPAPARVAILAGTGNNGGDGTCAAFYLSQWGYAPEIWLLRPPSEIRSSAARRCWERVRNRSATPGRLPRATELAEFPLVLDAMLGTGQTPPLRSPYLEAVSELVTSGAPVLSIDVPTGLGGDVKLRPRWTVALTAMKTGMAAETCGEVTVRSIGIPEEALRRTGPGDFLYFPVRRGARGRRGRLLVIGGGPYAGAPALAGLAALRSGAERATVIAPLPAAERVQSFSPALVVRPIGTDRFTPDDVPAILAEIESAPPAAVVLGMGAGAHPETAAALGGLVASLDGRIPIVVDADAIQPLASLGEGNSARDPQMVVATPNDGEYRRSFDSAPVRELEERLARARTQARSHRLTLVVKGEADLITDGERACLNLTHSPSMTVSGAGDVLAGVIGSLLAQGVPSMGAARLATYWAGEAGNRVAAEKGDGLIATDLIDALPAALVLGLERVRPS